MTDCRRFFQHSKIAIS